MPDRVTVSDIALYAGCSPATVSRVLNGKPNVHPDMRDKILKAAQALGYGVRPNVFALLVPDGENPVFTNLRPPFQEVLEKAGYHVLFASSEERPERELSLIQHFREAGVKGLFYIAGGEVTADSHLRDSGLPIVVLDRKLNGTGFDFVGVDNHAGVELVVDHFIELGHRSIGFIKGLRGTSPAEERDQKLGELIEERALEHRPEWTWEGDFSFDCGRRAAQCFLDLETRPTAVFACNDLSALGFMLELQRQGLRIPADVSVIGFDNVQFAAWSFPGLSTITQPSRMIAFEAARLMLERIATPADSEKKQSLRSMKLQPKLIARESTAPFR